MSKLPSQGELSALLAETWESHREFQEVYLKGVRDELWAGWYAAYLIGRLGPIMPPSRLAMLLESVDADHDVWTDVAAEKLLTVLGNS